MQRRAAAIYTVFFLLIAAGSYAVIGVAEEPSVSVDGPQYNQGETLTVSGRTYTVSSISEDRARLTWVNESARNTETWENDSTITLDGTDFRVIVDRAPEPTAFELREEQPLGENVSTVETGGTTYVVIETDGERDFVPKSEYLTDRYGEPEVRSLEQGDQLEYQNNTVEISSVTNESVTLAWTAPAENTVTMGEGDNVTLVDTTYVAHIPSQGTLQLSTDIAGYQREFRTVDKFQERMNGLWGVVYLSSTAAILLLGFAYLPSRY